MRLNTTENCYHNASDELIRRARILRQKMTPAERLLWISLSSRKLDGFKFRRQHPVYRFIVDFYCHQARLAIELDGNIHLNKIQKERDENRTYELNRLGIEVIRFSNAQVINDLDKVLTEILRHLKK